MQNTCFDYLIYDFQILCEEVYLIKKAVQGDYTPTSLIH